MGTCGKIAIATLFYFGGSFRGDRRRYTCENGDTLKLRERDRIKGRVFLHSEYTLMRCRKFLIKHVVIFRIVSLTFLFS